MVAAFKLESLAGIVGIRMLTTRMADDGLEYFALVERPNDGGDHVHQLKLLPFLKSSMGWPQRIE
jgi:hypothetical protein